MIRIIRFFTLSVFALGLASCGGAGLGGILGGGGIGGALGGGSCDPGTQVQLANPVPFQSGVNPNIGQIVIVASGNNNYLGRSYQTFNVTLIDDFGNRIPGGSLQPVAYPNGPHPYDSDFYYQSSFGPLQFNSTYTAELTLANDSTFNSCSFALQQFRT
ncbi:MAG TPA: hypothetical protein VFO29_02945 [Candidatus Rubrimentiphilum sp.]|nr:hypothetical protein [Candidatus Rubrimentiphilum sp.]